MSVVYGGHTLFNTANLPLTEADEEDAGRGLYGVSHVMENGLTWEVGGKKIGRLRARIDFQKKTKEFDWRTVTRVVDSTAHARATKYSDFYGLETFFDAKPVPVKNEMETKTGTELLSSASAEEMESTLALMQNFFKDGGYNKDVVKNALAWSPEVFFSWTFPEELGFEFSVPIETATVLITLIKYSAYKIFKKEKSRYESSADSKNISGNSVCTAIKEALSSIPIPTDFSSHDISFELHMKIRLATRKSQFQVKNATSDLAMDTVLDFPKVAFDLDVASWILRRSSVIQMTSSKDYAAIPKSPSGGEYHVLNVFTYSS